MAASPLLTLVLDHLASVIGFMLGLLLVSRVLRQHARPATSIAWFLLMVLAPYVGVPAYLLLGGRKLRQRAGQKPMLYATARASVPTLDEAGNDIARKLVACAMPPPRAGNRLMTITDGEHAYARLLEHIDRAKESIDMMTFILADDAVGRQIIDQLTAKARAGVKVRVLVDALGSLRVRAWRLRRLPRAGGEIGIFMPMLPLHRRWSANLRNHRKIALFDNRVAVTGGMNIATEYMGPPTATLRWIDSCVEMEGPAVADLANVFARDWEFATRESLPAPPAGAAAGEVTLQIVPTGPDVAGDPFYDVLTSSIYTAQQRIWLVTPYFVPDEGLLRALGLQARIGVDVRLVIPRRSNHRVADLARNRLLRELADAGVRIFMHPKRMIHAKQIVIDDTVAISGSVNMDARSLYLNYELGVFNYSAAAIAHDGEWIEALMQACVEGAPAEPRMIQRWAEDLCWLLSPLI